VLNDTNNETHQIRTIVTNNALKILKQVMKVTEKRKSISGKEEREEV